MKRGVDSRPPTDAQIAAAKAAGIDVWALYHGSPGDGIAPDHLASDADFDRIRKAGLGTLAYVSGNEDPRAIRAWSQATGVPTAVDCERFIREDGPWVPGWLAESGSGLYGNGSVHYDSNGFRKAACHIFAGYYGYDPRETWPNWLPHDATPTGFQWKGTTDPGWGIVVDLNWFDDAFAAFFGAGGHQLGGEDELTPEMEIALRKLGPYHSGPFTASLVAAAKVYAHPRVDPASVVKQLAAGVQVGFDSWLYTNLPYDDGRGPDYRWNHSPDGWVLANMCSTSPAPSVTPPDGEFDQKISVDLSPVTAAIADLRAHPAVVSDVGLTALANDIDNRLKNLTLKVG